MSVFPPVCADSIQEGTGLVATRRGRVSRWRGRRIALVLALGAVGVAATVVLGDSGPVLEEHFDGADGTFVSDDRFWGGEDLGRAQNDRWYANDGELTIRAGRAHTDDSQFRMWTRRVDLTDVEASFDMVFRGFSGGDEDWRGLNLWLNRTHCTPVPDCSAIDDSGGNSGYMLRFFAADGDMTVNKKVSGDTRGASPEQATSYVQGGTYYFMDKVAWAPVIGQTYRLTGSVRDNGDGTSTIAMSVDDEVLLEVVDDGSIGGERLGGGRVGVRGDYVDVSIDDLAIRR